MNTRIEVIDGYTYCAYCGKELKNSYYSMCPEPPTICNCEKAKEELDLYDKLKSLYNAPLAESLIEKKVQKYRNHLLGIKTNPVTYLSGKVATINCNDSLLGLNPANTTITTHHIDCVDGENKYYQRLKRGF